MAINLEDVAEPDVSNVYLKCLFYGQSGSGKTYLGLTFPKPLILNLEKGTGILKNFTSVSIDGYNDLDSFFSLLSTQKCKDKFDSVIVDSLDELIYLSIRDNVYEQDSKRMYGDQLTQADYGKIGRDVMNFSRRLLSYSSFYNVVFLCSQNPSSYEGEQRALGVSGKIVSKELPRLMDIVGCVFTDKEGGNKVTIANSIFAMGKNRYGVSAMPMSNTYQSLIESIEDINLLQQSVTTSS